MPADGIAFADLDVFRLMLETVDEAWVAQDAGQGILHAGVEIPQRGALVIKAQQVIHRGFSDRATPGAGCELADDLFRAGRLLGGLLRITHEDPATTLGIANPLRPERTLQFEAAHTRTLGVYRKQVVHFLLGRGVQE